MLTHAIMVVQKRTDVTQEAQDYLKQFKGTRSRALPRSTDPDGSFEAMLDTWTREKFQLKNSKKAATRAVNHRHHHHGDSEWDRSVPALFLGDSAAGSGAGMWTEGELFAEAELDQEQETYMNEEALLEQLLQQEPPRRGNDSKAKRPQKAHSSARNKNKRPEPHHSTPKTSAESFQHKAEPFEHDGEPFQHTATVHEAFIMDNVDGHSVPVRISRRGNPPPPPPPPPHPKQHDAVPTIDSAMPSCHNCGWIYTSAQNEVLDLPELLDILTPKSPRKVKDLKQELLLGVDGHSPPPLPSKPRPPPPAYHQSRSSADRSLRYQGQGHHSRNVNVVSGHASSHVPIHPAHRDPFSEQYNVFPLLPEVGGGEPLPEPMTSPRHRRTHSPHNNPATSPRTRLQNFPSRATQTDPNLLSHDLSPMALSSDTDNGKNNKEKLFTRAKPPSGPSVRERLSSFEDSQHLHTTDPILEAAKRGKLDTMKQILASDREQVKIRDIQGNTLLHICCERGHLACVRYLYHHLAFQSDDENKAKFTPAALTIKGGQAEVLDWLLENTEAKDEILPLPNKKSLLHHAAKFGQDGCLRIVLEKLSGMGRLTACCDGNGNSPAHVAAKHGHLSCLQILVEYGMDVTKANKYGHSPCYYADFSNHRQCAGYLMVVETCLNLAKKLIRLEKSMEQLSTSLAKYSGDFTQSEINLPYEYGADKSSATSSVEDDGTRDEAWHLLCRKFEEASKRLVVFRTQNRAIRPLKPTKLAMLALAQSKEESQAAFSALVGRPSSHTRADGHLRQPSVPGQTLIESRSRSFPDLLNVQSGGEEGTPSTEDRFALLPGMTSLRKQERRDIMPKHHHSHPDLTTSDDSSQRVGTDYHQFHFQHGSLPSPLSYPPPKGVHSYTYRKNEKFGQNISVRQREERENSPSRVYLYDNDLEYHLKKRVVHPSDFSFRPEKYLIQNWQQIEQGYPQPMQAHTTHKAELQRSPRTFREIPPPPLDNETSDFFEDSNGRHDSDTSELDQETLRKIFDMQEEIMRCHPQGAELGRARIQTPVKLQLTDQDFKEAYERCEGNEKEESTEEEPPILQRYRRVIRPRQPPPEPPPPPPPPTRHSDVIHDVMTGASMDVMNKSCNNSHTDSLDDSLTRGIKLEDTIREDSDSELQSTSKKGQLDPSKPWYEMTDEEETRNNRESEEYFTLL